MKLLRLLVPPLVLAGAALAAAPPQYAPPPSRPPDEATLQDVKQRTDRLAADLGSLRRRGVPDAYRVDA